MNLIFSLIYIKRESKCSLFVMHLKSFIFTELLLNNPGSSFFFAFGAGHFVGEHTIIDVVRRAGFNVEPVRAGDDLDNWVSSHVNKNGET